MIFAEIFGEPPQAVRRPARVKPKNDPVLMAALDTIRAFVPPSQLAVMEECLIGEEAEFFRQQIFDLRDTIIAMPVTYTQDGLGDDAVVHLHYFMGDMDWHITEQDKEGGGTMQAFGLANLGYGAELGYISIDELCTIAGMQLDLHWTPVTLQAVKAKEA